MCWTIWNAPWIFDVMRPGVCTRTTIIPVLNGTFQSSHWFLRKFCTHTARRWERNDGFFVYFWKIKGKNLQNNGVWRMVYYIMMYERGSWMRLRAMNFVALGYKLGVHEWDWVHERLFMPEGAARGHKKRSCTQSHSWTPFIHQFMMDHPSYAIILQIHTLNLPKIHEKSPFILPPSTFKSSRKIGDLLGIYHSKQGCALCVYIRLGA